jgi:Domain of unknown function (DUF4397)
MRRSPVRAALLAATVALLGPAAVALAPSAGATAPSYAIVRGAHFSPDTPGVDVYLTSLAGGTSSLWLSSVGYGDVSPYTRLPAGIYAVSMRPHGAAASTPAALSWTLNAQADNAYTAAAVGMNAQLHGIVLHDELNPPAAGSGRVRVIQAASRAPKATVQADNGPTVASDVAFATATAYSTVPAGTWPVTVTASGGSASLTTTSTVPINSASVHSIVVLDAKGSGLEMRTITDAAGAAVTPTGAVPAGGGGTANRDLLSWLPMGGLIGGTILTALLVGVILARRGSGLVRIPR